MGFLDKFKKRFERAGKEKKPRNVIEEKSSDTVKNAEPAPQKKSPEHKQKKADKGAKINRHDTKDAYRILRHALITEKASVLSAGRQYAFAVASFANKHQVAEAVQRVYGVQPVQVRVMTVNGKDVRFGRISGRTSDWKKAIITLKEGDSIDVSEGA